VKSESKLEIANTRNEIEAKAETLPAVPVPFRKNAETLDTAHDVLVQHASARNPAFFSFVLLA